MVVTTRSEPYLLHFVLETFSFPFFLLVCILRRGGSTPPLGEMKI